MADRRFPVRRRTVSRLVLRDLRDGREYRYTDGPVVIGRAGGCDLVVGGSGRELVSGTHARITRQGDGWQLEDAGGRNGTFLDGRRVRSGSPAALAAGQTLSLGELGPKFTVELEREDAGDLPGAIGPEDATVPLSAYQPDAPAGPAERELGVSIVRIPSGERLEAHGRVLRVGRGEECELRLPGEKIVSRVHCEIALGPDGVAVIRDADSRNGTMLDGTRLTGERALEERARIRLGPQGPELLVDHVTVTEAAAPTPSGSAAAPSPTPVERPAPPPTPVPTPPPQPSVSSAPTPSGAERRSFGGVGRTVFVRQLMQETEQKHASRVRGVVWTFVGLLVVAVGGVFAVSELRVRETQAELAEQREELAAARAATDSTRAVALAEYQELTLELEAARTSSAPAAVVESLRVALDEARTRTASLEAALERAQTELTSQLHAGDSLRRATEQETERLRRVLASSQRSGSNISAAQLDSLRQAVRAAEERAAAIESGLRAVRGADLARIAEANQAAVGLVSVFAGGSIYDGSGFVISKSGYFVTNRHVAMPDGLTPDSIHITMADQRTGHRAQLVQAHPAGGPDLAVLRIPRYVGPFIPRADWDGTRARQGEPAALIGFPAGVAAALDNTRTVRTSMSAGIFSKVTPTTIQFDGFTVGGSSGSPVFNADGEIVAVHASGLREAAGLGFAVPVRLVLPLLPADVRAEVTR